MFAVVAPRSCLYCGNRLPEGSHASRQYCSIDCAESARAERRRRSYRAPTELPRCVDCTILIGLPGGSAPFADENGRCPACARWAVKTRSEESEAPVVERVPLLEDDVPAVLTEIAGAHGFTLEQLLQKGFRDAAIVRARVDAAAILWTCTSATYQQLHLWLNRERWTVSNLLARALQEGLSVEAQSIQTRYQVLRDLPAANVQSVDSADSFLTASVVAAVLGITPGDLRYRIERGYLVAEKHAGRWWVRRTELERLLALYPSERWRTSEAAVAGVHKNLRLQIMKGLQRYGELPQHKVLTQILKRRVPSRTAVRVLEALEAEGVVAHRVCRVHGRGLPSTFWRIVSEEKP